MATVQEFMNKFIEGTLGRKKRKKVGGRLNGAMASNFLYINQNGKTF